jgi:hypothetical protein
MPPIRKLFNIYFSSYLCGYGYLLLFGCRRGLLAWREVEFQDGVGRTNRSTFPAKTTFVVNDIGQVIFHGDGVEGAYLLAFAAADAGYVAGFPGHASLIFVDTAHVDATRPGTLLTQLDDILGTGFHAGTTGSACVFHHLGKHGDRVDVDGIERAGIHTVTQTQAAEGTAGIAPIERRGYGAFGGPVVEVLPGTLLAAATTAYHCNLFCCFGRGLTQDGRYTVHRLLSPHGTGELFQRVGTDAGRREGCAAGEATAATVGGGEGILHLLDAGILYHFKFLTYQV